MEQLAETKIVKNLAEDFVKFLGQYGVIGMATGIVIGGAVSKLVTAFVNDIVMPIVGALAPEGSWRGITFTIGPVDFLIGDFLGALLDFTIIILVLYWTIKIVLENGKKLLAPSKEQPPGSKGS